MNNEQALIRYRPPYATPESRGATPPNRRNEVAGGMLIERDVVITLRDGVRIYADVFRSAAADAPKAAPLVAWGPYGKHAPNQPERYINSGLKLEHVTPYTAFEAPNPNFWVPNGYALVNVNPRGTWHSEGKSSFLSPQEALDFYDVIEWAGTQNWSNGKVGLSGVSYLAQAQWRVADLNPPHLAAINPWEGWSDTYREVARHGGIPDTCFWPYIQERWGAGLTEIEDLALETAEHPLFDEFWAHKAAQFVTTNVPAFVVASWTDHGLHTRGTLEGFKRIGSKDKWLEVHGRKKWAYYYEPASVNRLKEFFDHFLLGRDTGLKHWPKVRLEVRERGGVGGFRNFTQWPVENTDYRKLFLDAQSGRLQTAPPAQAATKSYDSTFQEENCDAAQFDFTFKERTDLVGNMKLHVVMAAESADDMDIFVGIKKLDAQGQLVEFMHYAQFDNGHVALGWLRASHRELDEGKSTECQPVLKHLREMKLKPGEPVALDIEILPSGTRFEAGETLRLVIQGSEIIKYPAALTRVQYRHEDTVNKGRHIVHTGAASGSYLLVPMVAPDPN